MVAQYQSYSETDATRPGLISEAGTTGRVTPEASHQSSPLANPTADIMATITTTWGQPKAVHDASPTDLITVNGTPMQLQTAEYMGYVQRDSRSGTYMPTGVKPQDLIDVSVKAATKASEEAAKAQPKSEPLDRQGEAIRNVFKENVSATTLAGVINQAVNNGGIDRSTLHSVASEMGLTPEDAGEYIEHLTYSLSKQRETVLGRSGVGAEYLDQFIEWSQQSVPDLVNDAHRRHLTMGDPSGWNKIAALYHENLGEIDPERILTADFGPGIKIVQHRGRVVLDIQGKGEMTYRDAVRNGVIRVR
jgi:hypothetical protein